jgi:hypothetical protein
VEGGGAFLGGAIFGTIAVAIHGAGEATLAAGDAGLLGGEFVGGAPLMAFFGGHGGFAGVELVGGALFVGGAAALAGDLFLFFFVHGSESTEAAACGPILVFHHKTPLFSAVAFPFASGSAPDAAVWKSNKGHAGLPTKREISIWAIKYRTSLTQPQNGWRESDAGRKDCRVVLDAKWAEGTSFCSTGLYGRGAGCPIISRRLTWGGAIFIVKRG